MMIFERIRWDRLFAAPLYMVAYILGVTIVSLHAGYRDGKRSAK